MSLPPDIISKIERDFAQNEVAPVIELVDELSAHNNGPFEDRVLRCVVYLSRGTYSGLTSAIATAREDWRDVILFAEYDSNDQHVRDLSKPFQSEV